MPGSVQQYNLRVEAWSLQSWCTCLQKRALKTLQKCIWGSGKKKINHCVQIALQSGRIKGIKTLAVWPNFYGTVTGESGDAGAASDGPLAWRGKGRRFALGKGRWFLALGCFKAMRLAKAGQRVIPCGEAGGAEVMLLVAAGMFVCRASCFGLSIHRLALGGGPAWMAWGGPSSSPHPKQCKGRGVQASAFFLSPSVDGICGNRLDPEF